MESIITFAMRALQVLLAATLAVVGFVFTLGLLCAVAVFAAAMLAVALISGRRPQLHMGSRFDPRSLWKHAATFRRGGFQRGRPGRAPAPGNDEVVDVEVREVAGPPRTP
jgi:hypothetical protein